MSSHRRQQDAPASKDRLQNAHAIEPPSTERLSPYLEEMIRKKLHKDQEAALALVQEYSIEYAKRHNKSKPQNKSKPSRSSKRLKKRKEPEEVEEYVEGGVGVDDREQDMRDDSEGSQSTADCIIVEVPLEMEVQSPSSPYLPYAEAFHEMTLQPAPSLPHPTYFSANRVEQVDGMPRMAQASASQPPAPRALRSRGPVEEPNRREVFPSTPPPPSPSKSRNRTRQQLHLYAQQSSPDTKTEVFVVQENPYPRVYLTPRSRRLHSGPRTHSMRDPSQIVVGGNSGVSPDESASATSGAPLPTTKTQTPNRDFVAHTVRATRRAVTRRDLAADAFITVEDTMNVFLEPPIGEEVRESRLC